jgi:hypothetical protein
MGIFGLSHFSNYTTVKPTLATKHEVKTAFQKKCVTPPFGIYKLSKKTL